MVITRQLIAAIVGQYPLPVDGVHGISHWARVYQIGCRLAPTTGARLPVVQLFAVLHDSRRFNEGIDRGHGARAAAYAATLRGSLVNLSDDDFALLTVACEHHTAGTTAGDVTVRTCWDSDRLDLGRVGIRPEPRRLCTAAAKEAETIGWAHDRATRRVWPALIADEWGVQRPGR